MQLEQIDPVSLQTLQGRVRGASDRIRRKILWNLSLAASARFAVMDKVVADLGRDHNFIPLVRERPGNQLFTKPVSISVSRIEERNTQIKRLVHQRDGFPFSKI